MRDVFMNIGTFYPFKGENTPFSLKVVLAPKQ